MKFLDQIMAVIISTANIPAEEQLKLSVDPVDEQLRCISQNVYHEARNESTAGMIAVVNVVLNRVDSSAFPNSACEVVYEGPHYKSTRTGNLYPYKHRCQFSWYCDGLSDEIKNIRKYREIQKIVHVAVKANIDVTDGATFYHADYVNPSWSQRLKKTTTIDRHIFYREK